jgi:hypothetical protein
MSSFLAGWVALAVAVILSTIKLTWWWGTSKKHSYVNLNQVRTLRDAMRTSAETTHCQHT